MQAKLSVVEGGDKGLFINIEENSETTIGRGKKCTLKIKDKKISSVHCSIKNRKDKITLKDLDSRNGTLVNDKNVEKIVLCHNDRIQLGGTVLLFEECEEKEEVQTEITQVLDEDEQPAEQEEIIGNYKIVELEGEVGSFKIYKAEHVIHKNIVFLKILPTQLMEDKRGALEEQLQKVVDLKNDRIASLYEYFWDGFSLIFITEYIQGKTLRTLLDQKKFSCRKALKILTHISACMSYIHSKKMFHNGLILDNVKIETGTKCIKLSDVSLYSILENCGLQNQEMSLSCVVYKPHPTIDKEFTRIQEDIYALGCILLFMIKGKLPRIIDSPRDFLKDLPGDVSPIVIKIFRKSLLDIEYQSVRDFHKDINKALEEV